MAHIDRKALMASIEAAAEAVVIGGRYQHYKTKGIYIVDSVVVLEATDQVAVAYYDEALPGLTWIREYSDFVAKIDESTVRFSLLS